MSEIGIGIGSTVWFCREHDNIRAASTLAITGETPRNWVAKSSPVDWSDKYPFPKKATKGERWTAKIRGYRYRVLVSIDELRAEVEKEEAEVAKWRWINANRHLLRLAVDRCTDPDIMRQIAALVGFVPEEPK